MTRRKKHFAKRGALLAVILTCPALLAAPPSSAQEIPPTLDPSRLRENLETPPPLREGPAISVPETAESAAPANADAITFEYRGAAIEGARALPEEMLMALWPYEHGETVSLRQVFAFAEAITGTYRQAGYALSFAVVPQQEIREGRFRIRVIEGYVDRIELDGFKDGPVTRKIMRIAERIKASRPLRTSDLERHLLLMNDLPGVDVTATLSPAEAASGAVLTLRPEHKPVEATLSYNSFLPESLGRHVAEASVRFGGLVTGSDSVRLTAQHSLTGEHYRGASLDASTGIGADGLRLGGSIGWTDADPDEELLDTLEYKARFLSGRIYGEYPVIRSRARNLIVGAAIAADDSQADILDEKFFHDSLREGSLFASFDFADATGAVSAVSGVLSQGVDAFGAQGESRADGELNYTKFEVEARRHQPLTSVFGGTLSANLSAHGQIASGSLFSAAECSYGGRRFGRGYNSGALSGDDCAQGYAALHWARPADMFDGAAPMVLDFYAFADGAYAWQKGALQPGEPDRTDAASAGLGLNIDFFSRATGLVEVSKQISHSDGGREDDYRITGAFTVRF